MLLSNGLIPSPLGACAAPSWSAWPGGVWGRFWGFHSSATHAAHHGRTMNPKRFSTATRVIWLTGVPMTSIFRSTDLPRCRRNSAVMVGDQYSANAMVIQTMVKMTPKNPYPYPMFLSFR